MGTIPDSLSMFQAARKHIYQHLCMFSYPTDPSYFRIVFFLRLLLLINYLMVKQNKKRFLLLQNKGYPRFGLAVFAVHVGLGIVSRGHGLKVYCTCIHKVQTTV